MATPPKRKRRSNASWGPNFGPQRARLSPPERDPTPGSPARGAGDGGRGGGQGRGPTQNGARRARS
eukprot:11206486-Lingulodinium_polyedra.AAC.1